MFHDFSRWLTIALLTAINLRIGLSVSNVDAQPAEEPVPGYVVESRTTRDGLPQNMIRSLLQTRDGYLWIGTSNAGLARFDGVAFDTTNTPALPSNSISALHEDVEAVLWIGTAAGLASYRDGTLAVERTIDGSSPAGPYRRGLGRCGPDVDRPGRTRCSPTQQSMDQLEARFHGKGLR